MAISGSLARLLAAAGLAALAALTAAVYAAAGGAPPPQTFAEKVLVSEVEVVVELPETLSSARRRALRPGDFVVQEDGVLRPVAKAEPIGVPAAGSLRAAGSSRGAAPASAGREAAEAGPWDLLVYVDRVLADPDMTFLGTVVLAEHAAALTRLGRVEIVIADPRPRQAQPATGEARWLEQTLAGMADEARRQRDRQARERRTPPEGGGGTSPDEQAVRRQQDRLLDFIAARHPSGPHALLLVAGGFEPRSGPAAPPSAGAEETALTLAAYGWVTIALPMQRVGLGAARSGESDAERLRELTGGGSAPPNILPSHPRETQLAHEGVINLFVEPGAGSLRALASLTAGTIVGYDTQLVPALDGLEHRWHLFYQAPDEPDGKLHQREVRLTPEGTVLRAPAWRRSSTPETVAAARLRLLLAGDAAQPGTRRLAVSAVLRPAAGRTAAGRTADSELHLAMAAFNVPDGTPPGPFRVSVAFAGDPATPIKSDRDPAPLALPIKSDRDPAAAVLRSLPTEPPRHQVLDRAPPGGRGWSQDLPVAVPSGARRLAVCVEDLAHQLWGGTTVDLAAQ
jgi:hypothetical protein